MGRDDPDDNRIVEGGVSALFDYIVTGDKDLLRLGSYDSIRTLDVFEFLKIVQGREPQSWALYNCFLRRLHGFH